MVINYKSVKGHYAVTVEDDWENLNLGDGKIEYNGVTLHLLFNGESAEDIKVNIKTRVVRSLDELFSEFDRIDGNNEHAQTRRHCSIEAFGENHRETSEVASTESDYIEYESGTAICRAISQLPPGQRDLAEALFFRKLTAADYARQRGISKAAVSKTFAKVQKNLKFFLKRGLTI